MKKIIDRIKMKNVLLITFGVLGVLLINACEDAIPSDYVEQKFVEAYLIVDEPIKNIVLMNTQPVNKKFDYAYSLIRDAEVKIIGDGKEFILTIDTSGEQGYYYPDTTYLVKPNTNYKLEIRIGKGDVITAETTTPARFKYTRTSDNILYYPKDTVKLPALDSFKLSWEPVPNVSFFILNLKCIDTIEYGKYLTPETDEKNRRIVRPWNEDWMFKEQSNTGFIPNTQTPVVWLTFKWYGRHEVAIFAPDWNYLRWFIQSATKNQYDPLLGSVKNAIGVFGSASAARDTFFLVKNQP